MAALTEEYFRVEPYRMDRIAVALSSFWTSHCTPYPEHAYLSASIVLEALLSTQEQEVTHQLAERAALLLASDGRDGVALYRLKELTELCVRLLRVALGDAELRSLIQGGDDQALDVWFLRGLMNADSDETTVDQASLQD